MTDDIDTPATRAVRALWSEAGHDVADLDALSISGPRHFLPSVFDVTGAAAASVAAANLAAARFWAERTGRPLPAVTVDSKHAAVAFRSERYLRVDSERLPTWDPVAGDYPAADGRWIRLHTNFPTHRAAALGVLGLPDESETDREQVAEAVGQWKAGELEETIIAANGCAAMMRSTEEWRAHPHGAALAGLPPVEIAPLGDAAPSPRVDAGRPLEGIRVLDLTRVIAGPVGARFLAACGAGVLRITSPHLPDTENLVIDTGFGKRTAQLDLREPGDRERFEALVAEADVAVQSYRPGALAALGYSPGRLAELRPGLVVAELSAYGRLGPWADRRGFDSLVQMVSGIAHAGAEALGVEEPRPLPAQALDHASGYLLAFGILSGLTRRAQQGGSWHVRLSLARTGRWIEDLGRVDALDVADPTSADVAELLAETDSAFGRVTHVLPAGAIDGSAHRWELPPSPPGSHGAERG